MIYKVLFLIVIFAMAIIMAYVVLDQWLPKARDKRMASLLAPEPSPVVHAITSSLSSPDKRWIERLANAAMNAESWLTSPLRIQFSNAGLNTPNMANLYFASKTLLTFFLPLLVVAVKLLFSWDISLSSYLTLLLATAAIGYYLPNRVLLYLVNQRQNELFNAFPDALDLLRVCIEAGLGLDSAVERVGREIQIESEALAEEFYLLGLELRAGATRANALRNLALRMGLPDIDALVAMLIQADRFGTSVANSLKVQSESLRNKRRLRAEEAAAKLPVKILMPLIFCVFPALLMVLLGPAIINVSEVLIPQLTSP